MATHNGSPSAHTWRHLDRRFDSLMTGMKRVVSRIMTNASGSPSRLNKWSTRATDVVKAHPYIAVGTAIALGYAIVRIARR